MVSVFVQGENEQEIHRMSVSETITGYGLPRELNLGAG
jgi:hypothetical protein